jgi:two-component system chemotaxis sensor kinase CheA
VLAAEEIVVKPLSSELQRIGAYAGATILGDGRVGLILDIRALARRAGLVGDGDPGRDIGGPIDAEIVAATTEPLLVVAVGEHRIAMPLSRVTRLEEIRLASVEPAAGAEVVQYRGDLMRLSRLSSLLGATGTPGDAQDPDAFVNVVVCVEAGHPIGLVVDAVLDIAHEDAGSRRASVEPGLAALAVVQGRVTEILDMDQALASHQPPTGPATRQPASRMA